MRPRVWTCQNPAGHRETARWIAGMVARIRSATTSILTLPLAETEQVPALQRSKFLGAVADAAILGQQNPSRLQPSAIQSASPIDWASSG